MRTNASDNHFFRVLLTRTFRTSHKLYTKWKRFFCFLLICLWPAQLSSINKCFVNNIVTHFIWSFIILLRFVQLRARRWLESLTRRRFEERGRRACRRIDRGKICFYRRRRQGVLGLIHSWWERLPAGGRTLANTTTSARVGIEDFEVPGRASL